jgi:hypothetical protein
MIYFYMVLELIFFLRFYLYFLLIKKEICFWTKSTHIEKCQQLKTVMWFRSIYKSTLHPVMRIVCQESTDLLKITLEAIGIFNL